MAHWFAQCCKKKRKPDDKYTEIVGKSHQEDLFLPSSTLNVDIDNFDDHILSKHKSLISVKLNNDPNGKRIRPPPPSYNEDKMLTIKAPGTIISEDAPWFTLIYPKEVTDRETRLPGVVRADPGYTKKERNAMATMTDLSYETGLEYLGSKMVKIVKKDLELEKPKDEKKEDKEKKSEIQLIEIQKPKKSEVNIKAKETEMAKVTKKSTLDLQIKLPEPPKRSDKPRSPPPQWADKTSIMAEIKRRTENMKNCCPRHRKRELIRIAASVAFTKRQVNCARQGAKSAKLYARYDIAQRNADAKAEAEKEAAEKAAKDAAEEEANSLLINVTVAPPVVNKVIVARQPPRRPFRKIVCKVRQKQPPPECANNNICSHSSSCYPNYQCQYPNDYYPTHQCQHNNNCQNHQNCNHHCASQNHHHCSQHCPQRTPPKFEFRKPSQNSICQQPGCQNPNRH